MTDYQPIRPSSLGAAPLPGGNWQFVVWAPHRKRVDLHLPHHGRDFVPMEPDALGYHRAVIEGVEPGSKYFYRLDDSHERPDPASRFQASGVHGPSEAVDFTAFEWTDSDWKGTALEDSVFYELHVGTFTAEGTFAALIAHLDDLAELGVTTIELMPIAQFPGARNWGYDGVYPFAVQNSYGSPKDLQNFVNAAHAKNLAVALDVVYNHLGPEGNYLAEYGPYFTDHYRTPWGSALNFDGAHSDEVRFFFIQNALYWLDNFHFDALRLDAVHSIFDASAFPFLAELSTAVGSLSNRLTRKIHLIAESDLNDARVLRPASQGGYGMDAQWSDDFHHSVHTLLTEERTGYYSDFGDVHHLAATLNNGWYYSGQYSRFRKRKHGNAALDSKRSHFVVCTQNHDQVGNRALGDRLSQLVSFESLKLAAGTTMLSSFVPLLFMGEEYGETAPFQFFTSYLDPQLAEAVRRGRREEFAAFEWMGDIPDPQAESTFAASRLDHSLINQEPHRTLWRFYQMLLQFKRRHGLLGTTQLAAIEHPSPRAVMLLHSTAANPLAMLFHFGDASAALTTRLPSGTWETRISSADPQWLGPGTCLPSRLDVAGAFQVELQPHSFFVLERSNPCPE
jgi:maltooligosyltrehalose trehalohydrolase